MSGEILTIQGIDYTFPVRPKLNTMRNYGLPRSQQVWSRRQEYLEWDWDIDSDEWDEAQLSWYWDELGRIYDGEWIIIDGKPTYINGMFYFFLQWFLLENEYYPEYRDTSLEYFMFVEIAARDPLCLGTILIKGRRLGASSMEAAILLRNLLIHRNKRNGIISKTGDDAKDIFGFAVIGFQGLPPFLKPQIEGNEQPKKEISVKKQSARIKKDQKHANQMEGLNNTLNWKATAMNSYDSGKLLRVLVDESAKWLEVNIQLYWKVVQKCLTKGAIVVGKASFVSTVNKGDKGGDNFRKLWLDSDPEKRNALGQTSSRLIRIFIPAYKGYEGYIDQFGNSVWDTPTPEQTEYLKTTGCPNPYIGAKEYIQMQRALVEHDPDLLAEEIRTAPFTWQEVFESAANSSYFRNVEELKERKKQLEEQLIEEGLDVLKGEFGRRGWFEFLKNGDAKFVDDPKGIWYVLDLLQDTPDLINRYRVKGLTKDGKKRKVPLNTEWGGAGWDPFAHAQATAEKGSDACCIIRSRYNLLDPENSDKPVAMLLGRMDNKDALHKQLFAGLTYYGVTVLGERAPTDWVDWAESEGYDDYVVETQRKSDGTVVRGINAQGKDAKEAHLTAMVEKSPQDTHKVGFIGIIKDRLDFDPDNRTDFDCAMADGYAIININQPLKKKKQKRTETVFVKRGKISVG